ncbi:hypothetical protein CR513_41199, partial [Mucuna pruriens]
MVVDNNNNFGGFLDAYAEATVDNFWTQPYVVDMSHVPSDLLVPAVVESEYFTPMYDDLWSQTYPKEQNYSHVQRLGVLRVSTVGKLSKDTPMYLIP